VIRHSLSAYSSKGGVGKSTLTVNLAVSATLAGWKVLTVDLDPQGNLAHGFGYESDDRYDAGSSLVRAVHEPTELLVLEGVRTQPGVDGGGRLDCVPGGPESTPLDSLIGGEFTRDPHSAPYVFDRMLAHVAPRYDLVLLDLPPKPSALHTAAFTTLHWIVATTATDRFSRGGMDVGFMRYAQVRRSSNPDLKVIAGVIARHDLSNTRNLAVAVADLEELFGGAIPLLEPPIRFSQKADTEMKELGIAAVEYRALAKGAKGKRLDWLRNRVEGHQAPPEPSKAAAKIAEDYDRIAAQILDIVATELSAAADQDAGSHIDLRDGAAVMGEAVAGEPVAGEG